MFNARTLRRFVLRAAVGAVVLVLTSNSFAAEAPRAW